MKLHSFSKMVLFLLLFPLQLLALHDFPEKRVYNVTNEPFDVLIPCSGKDLGNLELCIDCLKKNAVGARRIIVISDAPYTSSAEWFDEKLYPFTKADIAHAVFQDPNAATEFLNAPKSRLGWIYQQFLKLYAFQTIPDISSNILICDADTLFLNRVEFLDSDGNALFNPGVEYHLPYFQHMAKVLPWLIRVFPAHSGISHHMLVQKAVMQEFLKTIEERHNQPAWKTICQAIDPNHLHASSFSEYEMYFNFAFATSDQFKIRPLKWANIYSQEVIPEYVQNGYDYVSCHVYLTP